MKEIVNDLIAEQQALAGFLCSLKENQWDLPTPAEGWLIRDSITHISYTDGVATAFLEEDYSAMNDAIKRHEQIRRMFTCSKPG